MKKLFTLLAIVFAATTTIFAQQPGDLDPTFGENGVVMTRIGTDAFLTDIVENVIVQPDGKILAVGSSRANGVKRFAIVRYNTDGSIDNTFANNGIFLLNPYNLYGNFVMDADVLSDGKIIACCRFYDDLSRPVFLRLNPDGTLDNTFGTNGMVEHSFGGVNVMPDRFALQSDGKMIVTGYTNLNDNTDNLMLLRFNEDGSIDNTYGNNGFCVFRGLGQSSYGKRIEIQADNKAVVVGFNYDYVYDDEVPLASWLVVRVNEDGTPDNSFGEEGLRLLRFGGGHDFAQALAIQADGKIILGGHSWFANYPLGYKFTMVRLNTDGSFDTSFANAGTFQSLLVQGEQNYINDCVVTAQGNIYAAIRTATNDYEYEIGVMCLTPAGAINTAFGDNGYKCMNFNGSDNDAKGIALQEDGKILLAGEMFGSGSTGTPFGLVRFIPVPETTPSAINENTATTFSIYPNPATTTLTIQSETPQTIEISNVLGQIVYQTSGVGTITISVNSWENGIYLVRAKSETGCSTQKFIKQ